MQSLGVPRRPRGPNDCPISGARYLGEGTAAADLHLDQQGLAFMHTHSPGSADWLVQPAPGAALLVERVPLSCRSAISALEKSASS